MVNTSSIHGVQRAPQPECAAQAVSRQRRHASDPSAMVPSVCCAAAGHGGLGGAVPLPAAFCAVCARVPGLTAASAALADSPITVAPASARIKPGMHGWSLGVGAIRVHRCKACGACRRCAVLGPRPALRACAHAKAQAKATHASRVLPVQRIGDGGWAWAFLLLQARATTAQLSHPPGLAVRPLHQAPACQGQRFKTACAVASSGRAGERGMGVCATHHRVRRR